MEESVLLWLGSNSGLYVHASVFGLLILCGLGLPLPEDIPLIAGGIAASKNIVSIHAIFVTCYLGVIIGDQTMYMFGYFFGKKLLQAGTRSPFLPAITEDRVEKAREGLRKKRLLYILIARHLFPIRSATFVVAGSLHLPFIEFLISDALAGLISVSLVLAVGYGLGGLLTPKAINHLVKEAHFYIIIFVLLVLVFYLSAQVYILRKKKNGAA